MTVPPPAPPPRRRRLRRIALLTLLGLVVLPLLLILAIVLGLRTERVRQAILARVAGYLGEEYGLALTVEDFTPNWLGSGVTLEGVRIGAPGARPVAEAERVEVVADLGSLRRTPIVLRKVVAEGVRVDLTAPFPQIPEQPETQGSGLDILDLRVRRGTVIGPPLEKPMADWVTAWTAEAVEAAGSFWDGMWSVTVEQGVLQLERPGIGQQDLAVQGRVAYRDGEPLRFEGVQVTGEGLRLAASGSAGLEEGAPIAVTYEGEAEPWAILAGVPRGGRVKAKGDLRLPEAAGRVDLAAEAIPAEVARPYLDEKLYGDLSLAGTVADARVKATLGPGFERVDGQGDLTWRRGARRLARAAVRVTPGSESGIRLVAEGELLPGSPGRRSLAGTILAASWQELPSALAEEARAEVRLPDVRAALAEVRSLWPRLVPSIPEGVPVLGSLTADVRASGRLESPKADLAAEWLPGDGSRVRLRAEGRPQTLDGSARVEMQSLPLDLFAAWTGGLAGTVSGTVDLNGTRKAYRTRLAADLTGASLPPQLQGLDSARITGDGVLSLDRLTYRGTANVAGAGLFTSPNASDTVRVERFGLAADGLFGFEPLSYTGKATLDVSGVEAPGTAVVETARVDADGALRIEPFSYSGRLALDGAGLAIPGTAEVDRVRATAEGEIAEDSRRLSSLTAEAGRVVLPQAETEITDLRLEGDGDEREVRINLLSGALPEGRTFEASGRFTVEPLLSEADLNLKLARPIEAIPAVELFASLRGGVVEVTAPQVETATGPVDLRARVPLGSLRGIPQTAELVKSLPFEPAEGPVTVALDAPELDSEKLLAALGLEERPEKVRAGVRADLTLDPAAPAAGRGEIRITGLTAESPDARLTAAETLIVRLADGRLTIPPVHLNVEGAGLPGAGVDVRATADLDRSWNPFADPPASVVTRLSAEGSGTIEASLLNPFLEGGEASGSLSFDASASGPPDRLAGSVSLAGPGASFVWPVPYATEIRSPDVAVALADGRWTIRKGEARLNGGSVRLSGGGALGGELNVAAALGDVPYVLDYGLATLLSGDLAFRMPAEGRPRLSGTVNVERGVLNRDLNLDREVLEILLQPDDTPGTEETFLDTVDLDLRVRTGSGVLIRNNVADLRASWQDLRVEGTVENPVIRGRINVDPGGLLYAYGQTVRIDRGAVVFTGDPLNDPRLEFSTTSSLQDPTITRLRGRPLDILTEAEERRRREGLAEEEQTDLRTTFEAGLQGYYGARILSQLGSSLGLTGLTIQPVLVYGVADPSARLTVGRDLNRNVSFALSVDLRNAGPQVYVLDLHNFQGLPNLSVQGFTSAEEEGREGEGDGGSLQQVLEFGGSRVEREDGPRLRRLRIEAPRIPGILPGVLRFSVGVSRGDVLGSGAAFEAEVDVMDALRRRRYPSPRVSAELRPVEGRPDRQDLIVKVEPGPRAEFVFEGNRPPRGSRRQITALYRTDFAEPASLAEMEEETVRAFRSLGHLEPEVAIEAQRERPEDQDSPRTVTIRSQAGPRLRLEEIAVPGLSPQELQVVVSRFPGVLSRAELAAGEPSADRRFAGVLRTLGWPEARVTGRSIGDRGRRLTLRVDLGERQTVASVEIAGADPAETARLQGLLPVQPGDPARLDLLVEGARRLEADLEARGYSDAEVRFSQSPAAGATGAVDVAYEVTPGRRSLLAGIDFEGERWSRPRQLERITGLETGKPLNPAELDEARGRLFELGIFSRVTADVEKTGDGEARVSFSLAERPRFRVGYGVQFESGVGTSAVVDVVDQNFLGRAMTLGVRGLYEQDDQSGRLLLQTGRLLGTPMSLEAYALGRRSRREDENVVFLEDIREYALQLARPFSRRSTGRIYARYRLTHLFEEDPNPFFPIDFELALPYIGTQFLYDRRNDRVDPTGGRFASLDLSGSGAFVGSDFEYARFFGQLHLFRRVPVAGRSLTWAQSVRAGLAKPFSGQELVSLERFRTGGAFSVRGYEPESLGPTDVFGDPVGGEALFVLNEEIRFPLPFLDLTAVGFFDAGQVWADPDDFGSDLAKSLGLGLRARTPLGLLRFDAAFPLDRREGDDSYKLYLGFGNVF
ncbi:MAG TPA: translocation/assembly module TamB domain-containing protein [Thermoanaerobaculia bacterium]|nr:translocation/assembly module TamB domain-containing protein [Thermoanaerobaculia bacterium]